VLVGQETSNLLLALAHAAWLGQAFARRPLRVLGTITHQTLATWVPAWPHQDSQSAFQYHASC
jgi:hypothetical protein